MDSEKDLIDAFEGVVRKDFQNPQRIGCPDREMLARFAVHPTDPEFAMYLAHIRRCARCFDELKELRQSTR